MGFSGVEGLNSTGWKRCKVSPIPPSSLVCWGKPRQGGQGFEGDGLMGPAGAIAAGINVAEVGEPGIATETAGPPGVKEPIELIAA